jgi:isovaleryl-CoA dehydrogenase
MRALVPDSVAALCERLEQVVAVEIAPQAEHVDRDAVWPQHSMASLGRAGLLGLNVPADCGGLGQGLLALTAVTEVIAHGCPSSALCFGMHCVGSAVIAAKATEDHKRRYLRPIAEGSHVTSLAAAEAGTGVHFYLPRTRLERSDHYFLVSGEKSFVTNGGHADSYVVSTMASLADQEAGDFSCVMVDRDTPGLTWKEPWRGVGMRGNSSRAAVLASARVPIDNLLGEEGDHAWYVFEVVAPYFLTAMAGTYLGIAREAYRLASHHLSTREYAHLGETLAENPVLQHRLADLWLTVERARTLVYTAARLGDAGDPQALPYILAAKAEAGTAAVTVTNEAMTLCGGAAYRENAALPRLLRDARASHVMSPSTDLLKLWLGRTLLNLPLF